MIYRKATTNDIYQIAYLITKTIGTCNIKSSKNIFESNIEEVTKDIKNYYVCSSNKKIIGLCGISKILNKDSFNLGLKNVKEILYFCVEPKYQFNGIGTNLLKLCINNIKNDIIFEAWGDNGKYVNSKFILEKNGFRMVKNLGDSYYRKNNYCHKCINKNKGCNKCIAEIWVKYKTI